MLDWKNYKSVSLPRTWKPVNPATRSVATEAHVVGFIKAVEAKLGSAAGWRVRTRDTNNIYEVGNKNPDGTYQVKQVASDSTVAESETATKTAFMAHLNNADAHGLGDLRTRVGGLEIALPYSVALRDTFSAADGALHQQPVETGPGYFWYKPGWAADALTRVGGKARGIAAGANVLYVATAASGAAATFTDFIVGAEIPYDGWLYYRLNANNAQGYAILHASNGIQLVANLGNGVETMLFHATTDQSAIRCAVRVQGSNHTLFVNGVPAGTGQGAWAGSSLLPATIVDTRAASGTVGLRQNGNTATMDNFKLAMPEVF